MLVSKNLNSEYDRVKELSHAIVQQAAEDYLEAKKNIYLEGLMREPDKHKIASLRYEIRRIKDFFNSEWYSMLCKIDSKYWIPSLDAEHERRKANNFEEDT